MKVAWHPCYNHPLPSGHRFPMVKYDLLLEQLLHEGTIDASCILHPHGVDVEALLRTHDSFYLSKLFNGQLSASEIRRSGFPYSPELIHREIVIMGGTLQCARVALEEGLALNIAGGTHHAYSDRSEGFCLLNDFAIAINVLLSEKKITTALVVDLDVHQGNGTASIFQHDDRVFTFSMHGEKNYPMHKEQSSLDVGLPDGIEDTEYLSILERHLDVVLHNFRPDLVCYQCGVDVLAADKLGRLGLSLDGCRKRDEMVFSRMHSLDIPVVCAMGGGYAEDIRLIVEAHANTFRLARHFWA